MIRKINEQKIWEELGQIPLASLFFGSKNSNDCTCKSKRVHSHDTIKVPSKRKFDNKYELMRKKEEEVMTSIILAHLHSPKKLQPTCTVLCATEANQS
jgi:hypothetical protein